MEPKGGCASNGPRRGSHTQVVGVVWGSTRCRLPVGPVLQDLLSVHYLINPHILRSCVEEFVAF